MYPFLIWKEFWFLCKEHVLPHYETERRKVIRNWRITANMSIGPWLGQYCRTQVKRNGETIFNIARCHGIEVQHSVGEILYWEVLCVSCFGILVDATVPLDLLNLLPVDIWFTVVNYEYQMSICLNFLWHPWIRLYIYWFRVPVVFSFLKHLDLHYC